MCFSTTTLSLREEVCCRVEGSSSSQSARRLRLVVSDCGSVRCNENSPVHLFGLCFDLSLCDLLLWLATTVLRLAVRGSVLVRLVAEVGFSDSQDTSRSFRVVAIEDCAIKDERVGNGLRG